MRRSTAIQSAALTALSTVLLSAGHTAHAQEEGRFDAQVFRPSAAPRDLVMIQKAEVIGHLSPTFGIYSDLGFDPLVILSNETGDVIEAVGARFQITGLAGIGLYDWFDLKLAVPFVAWQDSENLRPVGSEGEVQTTSVGDVRLSGRVLIPGINRKRDAQKGLGMAIEGNLNLPSGTVKAFSGDGVLTGGVTLITDYRLDWGALVTANAGIWLRPERQFAGVRVGDMASVGLAAETYLVQSWGLSVLGGMYGYPSLHKFPDSARQLPAEVLLALRWQTQSGFTFTFGGSFGAACGFGAPAIRFFNGIIWTPKTSREQEEINRILEREKADPDEDGLMIPADHCPDEPGPPGNDGCPDTDSDNDGVADRLDGCPTLPGSDEGKKGCPAAYVKQDQIVITQRLHFATDNDIILDESKPVLDAVAIVLNQNPDILELRIEGHTDIRASDAYNLNLSHRRAHSVRTYLISRGVDPTRLKAQGYGHTQPLYDDSACNMPDEQLTPDCKFMTSENRRVIFRIMRRGLPGDEVLQPPSSVQQAPPGNTPVQTD